jgi:hypothetical protein
MNFIVKTVSCLLIGWACIFQNLDAAENPVSEGSQPTSRQNERLFFDRLWPVLGAASKGVRIYYAGDCTRDIGLDYVVPFPQIKTRQPSSGKNDFLRLQEMLQDERQIRVEQDFSGVFRITVGDVPQGILRTRISRLALDPDAQYNAGTAVDAIADNEQVQAAMRALGLEMPMEIVNSIVVSPDPKLPHLESSLIRVTMDQALDVIAAKFHGAVLYGICPDHHIYSLEFSGPEFAAN